jgi:hypothetical protein
VLIPHGNCAPHPFRFGLINETPCPSSGWTNHVRQAETLGYSTFLIRDHLRV